MQVRREPRGSRQVRTIAQFLISQQLLSQEFLQPLPGAAFARVPVPAEVHGPVRGPRQQPPGAERFTQTPQLMKAQFRSRKALGHRDLQGGAPEGCEDLESFAVLGPDLTGFPQEVAAEALMGDADAAQCLPERLLVGARARFVAPVPDHRLRGHPLRQLGQHH